MSDKLLKMAAKSYGYTDVMDMLEATVPYSVVPGICADCHYTTDVEPDGIGWCEECGKASVQSVLLLAGII